MYDSLHLTTVHRPDDVRIFHKECGTLAAAGFKVGLIAAAPGDAKVQGIDLLAIPLPVNRRARMTHTWLSMLRRALSTRARIYHFHDPELLPIGLLLRLLGRRVIYDTHEDLPGQIMGKPWIAPALRRLVALGAALTEKIAGLTLSAVVAAGNGVAQRFPKRNTIIVQNYPILDELITPDPLPYEQRPPVVAYVGGITAIRATREMVRAMELLPEDTALRLVLAGTFNSESLERECRAMAGWAKVEALGWQNRHQVADLLGRARMGVVVFMPLPNHMDLRSNKLFEYMSAGLPVIASDFPIWREVVDSVGCGILVDPASPEAISRAFQWFLEHPEEAQAMGRRGQEAVKDRYNWAVEGRKLVDLYKGLLA